MCVMPLIPLGEPRGGWRTQKQSLTGLQDMPFDLPESSVAHERSYSRMAHVMIKVTC